MSSNNPESESKSAAGIESNEPSIEAEEIKEAVKETSNEKPESKPKSLFVRLNIVAAEKGVTAAFSIVLRVLLTCLIVIAGIFMFKELTNTNLAIRSFSVPASLEQAGYAGSVVANKVFNELNLIIDEELLSGAGTAYKDANSSVDLNVDVAGIGVPIRSLTNLIGESIGIKKQNEINGSVVRDGDTLLLEIRISGKIEKFKTSVHDQIEAPLNILTFKAAEAVLKYSNPYVLARHYLTTSDSTGAHALGNYLIHMYEGDSELEAIGYYAIAAGYAIERKFELMEKTLRKGIRKYARDINLNAALSSCLTWQGKLEEALILEKQILGMIDVNTSIQRKTDSYSNLGETYFEMGKLDSALFFIRKAVEIDKKYFNGYRGLCRIYATTGDKTKLLSTLETALSLGWTSNEAVNLLKNYPELMADTDVKQLLKQYSSE